LGQKKMWKTKGNTTRGEEQEQTTGSSKSNFVRGSLLGGTGGQPGSLKKKKAVGPEPTISEQDSEAKPVYDGGLGGTGNVGTCERLSRRKQKGGEGVKI